MHASQPPKDSPFRANTGGCPRVKAVARIRHLIDDATAARLLEGEAPSSGMCDQRPSTKLERTLLSTLPQEEAVAVAERALGTPVAAMLYLLSLEDGRVLARLIGNEYPQLASVVLTRMLPQQAAIVLSYLPESFAIECIIRLYRIETRTYICDFESSDLDQKVIKPSDLGQEFISGLFVSDSYNPIKSIAEIFRWMDRSIARRFIFALEERRMDWIDVVRAEIYSFEQICHLSPRDVVTVLKHVDILTLAMALKTAPSAVRNAVFRNMSYRQRRNIIDEIDRTPDFDNSDAMSARNYIAQYLEYLIDREKITDVFHYDLIII